MPISTTKPSIHGPELRLIVLEAIPSLSGVLGDENMASPHKIMGKLFDHATRVIQNGDLPDVIQCFRLTKKLVELREHCDVFVRSAIWASYIHRFPSNDALALNVFLRIDPRVRETLFSPFVSPHYWLREVEIPHPDSSKWKTWVTIGRQVEAESRIITQASSRDHFAIVRLRLEPSLDERSVLFRNCLDDSNDAPLEYVNAVIEGVTRVLAEKCNATRGVSYLRIDLLGLRHNLVDSSFADFVATSRDAVERCFHEGDLLEF